MAIRALIIAIERYPSIQGFGNVLPGTTAAGVAFRKWLIEVKKAPPENIQYCTEDVAADGRTSGAAIDDLIKAVARLSAEGRDRTEQLYVFFSGHGFLFREDPHRRLAADVLVASDFSSLESPTAGRFLLRLEEVQTKLQLAMGPRDHFYFIDACRNHVDPSQVDVAGTGLNLGRSVLGNPTVYTLYSTSRGSAAFLKSRFSRHLLAGLGGAGRAKIWRITGDGMEVRHSSLREYVAEKLPGEETDSRVDGGGEGVILEIRPAPNYNCDIEVEGANPREWFTLTVTNSRGQQVGEVKRFKGPRFTFSEPPDFYSLGLRHEGQPDVYSMNVRHDDGSWEPKSQVDLWETSSVLFTPQPPDTDAPAVLRRNVAGPARLRVVGAGSAELVVEDLRSGLQKPVRDQRTSSFEAGKYVVKLRSAEEGTLREQFVELAAGRDAVVDLSSRPESRVRSAILSYLPAYAYDQGTVSFSESLGLPSANDDLGLWLAIVGASRIVEDPGSFIKLQQIPLASFEDVPPSGSAIYVLAGWDHLQHLRVAVGDPQNINWQEAQEVTAGVPVFRHVRIDHPAGPALVSLAADREAPLTIATHCLPNRVTLMVVTIDVDSGLQVQQYLLPLHHLLSRIAPGVQRKLYDGARGSSLAMVRFIALAQKQFARKRNVASVSEVDWRDLLHGKWLDPIMATLAAYELVRSGRLELIQEVVGNLRRFFAGLPDTEVLAKLAGQRFRRPASVPLFLEGLIAVESYEDLLPLPEGKLDYRGPWTAWWGAVKTLRPLPPSPRSSSETGTGRALRAKVRHRIANRRGGKQPA